MLIDDIIIPKVMTDSTPKESKMNRYRSKYKKTLSQDRYIVVNKNGCLVDGYIMYLVLKEFGVKECQVIISKTTDDNAKTIPRYKKMRTAYIYGTHTGDCFNGDKIYVWRVPNSWGNADLMAESIQIGDIVTASTHYGKYPVEVTGILVTNNCPLNMSIKTLTDVYAIRNGEKIKFA